MRTRKVRLTVFSSLNLGQWSILTSAVSKDMLEDWLTVTVMLSGNI